MIKYNIPGLKIRTLSYFGLIAIFSILLSPCTGLAQVYNLTKILEKEGYKESDEIQLHSINDHGLILGSAASKFDPDMTLVFVLNPSLGGGLYEYMEIGQYAQCEPVEIDAQNRILINASVPGRQYLEPYMISNIGSPSARRLLPKTDVEAHAVRLLDNQVAINAKFSGLPDRSQYLDNPFRNEIASIDKIPNSATKGSIHTLNSLSQRPSGFPAAFWYNLPVTIYDVNKQGHSCGQSAGYTLGENMSQPYPFLATQDSVYRLLDGQRGAATAMNIHDQVIGNWQHPLTGKEYGFYFEPSMAVGNESIWLDLATALPEAINRDGIIVGQETDTAFVMIELKFVDKHKVIPSLPRSWKVLKLNDINDQLRVLGVAEVESRQIFFCADLIIPD